MWKQSYIVHRVEVMEDGLFEGVYTRLMYAMNESISNNHLQLKNRFYNASFRNGKADHITGARYDPNPLESGRSVNLEKFL